MDQWHGNMVLTIHAIYLNFLMPGREASCRWTYPGPHWAASPDNVMFRLNLMCGLRHGVGMLLQAVNYHAEQPRSGFVLCTPTFWERIGVLYLVFRLSAFHSMRKEIPNVLFNMLIHQHASRYVRVLNFFLLRFRHIPYHITKCNCNLTKVFIFQTSMLSPFKIILMGNLVTALEVFNRYGLQNVRYTLLDLQI